MKMIKDGCAFATQQMQDQCPVKWPRCPYCRRSGHTLPDLDRTTDSKDERKAAPQVSQKETAGKSLLTPDEAATYLKITAGELRDLRYRSRVAYVKVGYRTVRYRQDDLDAFITRYRVTGIRGSQ